MPVHGIGPTWPPISPLSSRVPVTLALLAALVRRDRRRCGISGAAARASIWRWRRSALARWCAVSFSTLSTMGGSGGFHGMKHISVGYIWAWAGGILLLIHAVGAFAHLAGDARLHDDETAAGLVGLDTTTVTKVAAFGVGRCRRGDLRRALRASSRLYRAREFRLRALDRLCAGGHSRRLDGGARRARRLAADRAAAGNAALRSPTGGLPHSARC